MTQRFCGMCGAPSAGGLFCEECGAPMVADSPTPTSEQVAPVPQPDVKPVPEPATTAFEQVPPPVPPAEPSQAQPAQPAARPLPPDLQSPATAAVNPFAGLPVGDLARDAGALFLLFGSLALPWDSGHQASERWWVVLATIASALSLALPYLTAARVIPGWGGPQVRLAKLAAQAPYAVCVLVVVLNELINLTDEFAGGIGSGVCVGLAGVMLVLQPRAVEDDATSPNRALWHRVSVLLATAGLVLVAVGTVIFVISNIGDANDSILSFLGIMVLLVGTNALVVVLSLAPYAARSRPGARVFATVGFTMLAVAFLATAGDGNSSFYEPGLTKITGETFLGPAPTGVFLITAAAALAVARAVPSTLKQLDPVTSWVQTASLAFMVAAAGLALSAVGRLLILVDTETYEASTIVPLVLMVVAAIAALVARTLTQTNADLHRGAVIALTGGIVLVAIVAIAVGNSGASTDSLTASDAVVWFAMPGLVLWSLLVPGPVRTTFKPLANTPPATGA